jgi:hypothetical protein
MTIGALVASARGEETWLDVFAAFRACFPHMHPEPRPDQRAE